MKEVQGSNPTFSVADIHGKHYLTNVVHIICSIKNVLML